MKTFLGLIAEEFCTLAHDFPYKYCIVLPSRRACLFLKKEIQQRVQGPLIMPKIYSFEDFIYAQTPFQKPEPLEDIMALWHATRKVKNLSDRSFDEILDWGQIVINDFNEVDAYLIDPDALFKTLENIKAYEIWGRNTGAEISKFQRIYLDFYSSLAELYQGWTQEMTMAGLATQGGAARWLATHLPNIPLTEKYEKIIFAGLNALTPAERKIIEYFKKEGKAILRYDADRYYFEDKAQEAGLFLRELIDIENDQYIGNDLIEKKRTINILGISGNVSQVRFLHQYISNRIAQEGTQWLERTAIVLADESLLIPVLQGLPAELGMVNVTMGLPLSNTPASSLMHSFFKFFQESSPAVLHLNSLLELLMHPWIRSRLASEGLYLENQLREWLFAGRVRISYRKFSDALLKNSSLGDWFYISEGTPSFTSRLILNQLHKLIAWLRDTLQNPIQDEFLYALSLLAESIEQRLSVLPNDIQISTLEKLIQWLHNSTRIPFSGEPLEGLQVMGMLETRALDFETVIFLSASDDILPGSGRTASFIPYDVRIEPSIGLPVVNHKNAIMAYHFYRLLQRCSEAVVFYNNQAGDLGKTGEVSRFVQQINYEFSEKHANTVIQTQNPTLALTLLSEQPKIFTKTPDVLEQIHEMNRNGGFSASALWTYNLCPYKFYLDYVLQLRTSQTDPLKSAPMIFGQVIHGALKLFYPPPPCYLTPENYDLSGIENLVDLAFQQSAPGADLASGHLRLIKNAAVQFVKRFLKTEMEILETSKATIEILALEKKYSCTIKPFNILIEPWQDINIQGIFDRLEKFNGKTRILDYKTGNVNASHLRLQLDDINTLKDRKWEKVFQLMIYKWLYQSNNPEQNVEVGIIPLKISNQRIEIACFEGASNFMDFVEKILSDILSSIMSPEVPFEQTHQKDMCIYCNYRLICGRLS